MNLPNYKEARNRLKNYRTVKYDIEKSIINKYSGKTYFLKTYGCQMNEHDSENIRAMLEELGFKAVEDYTQADLIMLNTCSIDRKSTRLNSSHRSQSRMPSSA